MRAPLRNLRIMRRKIHFIAVPIRVSIIYIQCESNWKEASDPNAVSSDLHLRAMEILYCLQSGRVPNQNTIAPHGTSFSAWKEMNQKRFKLLWAESDVEFRHSLYVFIYYPMGHARRDYATVVHYNATRGCHLFGMKQKYIYFVIYSQQRGHELSQKTLFWN